jgi:hypothetical protein
LTTRLGAKAEKIAFTLPLSEEQKRGIRQEFAATPDSEAEEAPLSGETAAEETIRVAEAAFTRLAPADQNDAQRVLLRLVRIDEGVQDSPQRVKAKDLDDFAAVLPSLESVGLIKRARDGSPREQAVEFADVAVVMEWPRLRQWIEDNLRSCASRSRIGRRAASRAASCCVASNSSKPGSGSRNIAKT